MAEEARDFVFSNSGVEPDGRILDSGASEAKPCQAALDNLPSGEVGATLPVLVAIKGGFRFGEVGYELA